MKELLDRMQSDDPEEFAAWFLALQTEVALMEITELPEVEFE
jgi:hypothetical protein